MDQGTETMDAHTAYHIKGPKAKHEMMRGKWGKELNACQSYRTTETVQENLYAPRKCFPQLSPI